MFRPLSALALILVLAGCATQSVAQVPVEVTREVVRVETKVVVVTAVPAPAALLPPQPSVTAAPSAIPTASPEPTAVPAPTTPPEPTAIPVPTTAPALEAGETVPGRILRTIRVYDIPNEYEGREVITAKPGDTVEVLYRGGQWYQVQGKSTDDETVTGWVYHDWISIAAADEARLQANPNALPVIVTKITQTVGDNYKKYWTGTVMNIGTKTAMDVQVEISLNGQVGDTETRADRGTSFVVARNLEPGQASKFSVQTNWMHAGDVFYTYKVLWTEQCGIL